LIGNAKSFVPSWKSLTVGDPPAPLLTGHLAPLMACWKVSRSSAIRRYFYVDNPPFPRLGIDVGREADFIAIGD